MCNSAYDIDIAATPLSRFDEFSTTHIADDLYEISARSDCEKTITLINAEIYREFFAEDMNTWLLIFIHRTDMLVRLFIEFKPKD